MQQVVNILVSTSVYALFALGFNLVLGVLNILNLAQAALFTSGAFLSYWLSVQGVPLWLAFLSAVAGTALLSLVVGETSLAPLRRRGAGGLTFMVASLGAGMAITSVIQLVSAARVLKLPAGSIPGGVWQLGPVRVAVIQCIALVTALVAYGLTSALLTRSKVGKAVRAVEFDQTAAVYLGLPTESLVRLMFLLSGALAGAAGVVVALLYSTVSYDMGGSYLLKGFVIIVLGGFGSVPGTVLASLVLAATEIGSVVAGLSGFADAISFGILIIILLVRPGGLLAAGASSRP